VKARSFILLCLLVLFVIAGASLASTQTDDVLNAAKQVQALIDQLADSPSTNELQLGLAWRALNEAEYRLPPDVKASVVGGGPPKGYMACHVMLANAGNSARLRAVQRAHQETQAAIQCYANALGLGSQPTDDCETYAQTGRREPRIPNYQLACPKCKSDPSYPPAEMLRLLNIYWSRKFGVPPYIDLVSLSPWNNPTDPVHLFRFEPSGPSYIRYDTKELAKMVTRFGPFAPVTPFAHEFGHYVQALGGRGAMDRSRNPDAPDYGGPLKHGTPSRELDADRLAGAFIHGLVDEGKISAGCLETAKSVVSTVGDPTHGSGPQRAACLQYGYDHGPIPFTRQQAGGDTPVNKCAFPEAPHLPEGKVK
jgi:hypothetical protein